MKKQVTAVVLCAAMAFTMGACGKAADVETEATEAATVTSEESVFMALPTAEEASVSLGDFDNLTINLTDDYEVSEASVKELCNNVLYNYSITAQVEDRDTVQEDDLVMVDYTGYQDGEAFDGGSATDQLLDVANNCAVGGTSFIDGFTSGLVGAKVGETVSSEVTFPEDYGVDSLNGQTVVFEFAVKGIYAADIDLVTDEQIAENCADTFGVSTVEDFKAYVKAYLVSSQTYSYVSDYVVANSTCTIPDEYMDYVVDLYVNYIAEQNFGSMEALEETYTASGYSMDDLYDGVRESMLSQIESEVIFNALADKMGIEISDEEQSEMLSSYLTENGGSYDSEEDILLAMGLGNLEFGEEYAMISARTSEVITQIVANSTVIDADGNTISNEEE